ncbi:hypothetical protein [Dendronalium sp. ChiSLP03b]|uniref:hypothetical protein n=1 Tax=Dendronalium sp. ChiSLP03b TaxID=3075381 RepID=UPI002AD36E58|nr:hypothetical protein [Dendronalium sp. ChiSLP03b]MDZ8207606.1 hypothetical protein [Dendronalium sp. ChiSLP03b]
MTLENSRFAALTAVPYGGNHATCYPAGSPSGDAPNVATATLTPVAHGGNPQDRAGSPRRARLQVGRADDTCFNALNPRNAVSPQDRTASSRGWLFSTQSCGWRKCQVVDCS